MGAGRRGDESVGALRVPRRRRRRGAGSVGAVEERRDSCLAIRTRGQNRRIYDVYSMKAEFRLVNTGQMGLLI